MTQFSESCKRFLESLRAGTKQLPANPIDTEIKPNDSGVGCSAKNVVAVKMATGRIEKMHANWFPAENNKTYLAGQSPGSKKDNSFAECEKFLMQGIESGQGIFQFVSRRAHFDPENSREMPIIGQLMAQWAACNENPKKITIGGRYEVTEEPRQSSSDTDHKHCQLTVRDISVVPATIRTVILTQAGLQFTNAILRSNQIRRAEELLEKHNRQLTIDSDGQAIPMLVSYIGGGRNATLITYKHISDKIKKKEINTEAELDKELRNFILANRAIRNTGENGGPQFIHSDAQVNELRKTLLADIKDRTKVSESPRPSTAMVSTSYLPSNLPVKRWEGHEAEHTARSVFGPGRFKLRDNGGGGNCLFYSLLANSENKPVSAKDAKELRIKTAEVLEYRTTEQIDRNEIEIAQLLTQLRGYDDNKRMKYLKENRPFKNKKMAEFQKKSENFASDMDIEQWLEIAGNEEKTVTVVDADKGNECVVVFTLGGRKSYRLPLKELGDSHDSVLAEVMKLLKNAMYSESSSFSTSTPKHIALYRTKYHFQRIAGINL